MFFVKTPTFTDKVFDAAIPVGVGLVASSFVEGSRKANKKAKKKKKARKGQKKELSKRLAAIDDSIVAFAERGSKARAKAEKAKAKAERVAEIADIVREVLAQASNP